MPDFGRSSCEVGARRIAVDNSDKMLEFGSKLAREMYAGLWLKLSEVEVKGYLQKAGFDSIQTSVVHREHGCSVFETMLAVGEKA